MIKFTEKQQEFLVNLSKEINEQDNLITQDPSYCVYDIEEHHCDSDIEYDRVLFVDDEGEIEEVVINEETGETEKLTEENYEGFDQEIRMVYVKKHRVFKNSHLTMRSAKLFITQNRHNLNEPFVYVESMYRCWEMIELRELLESIVFQTGMSRFYYCPSTCEQLSPTERIQDEQKSAEPHECKKYNRTVYHNGHHPQILKCKLCLNDIAIERPDLFDGGRLGKVKED